MLFRSHRLWQLLLKGYEEVRGAHDPLVAAQMALLRVMHAADLPDPGGLIKQLEAFAANPPAVQAAAAPAGGAAPVAAAPPSAEAMAAQISGQWAQLVEQVEQISPLIGSAMRLSVRVVSLAPGHLVYALAPGIPGDPTADMRRGLEGATGGSWRVERTGDLSAAMPSLEEARAEAAAREDAALREDPLVRAAFAAFPGAEMIDETTISATERKPWSKRA